mmetsp:Transcript_51729/g.121448  ORF Transcript_51729/g.121448 Transcript_51729/m.121448 type:complete len:238 (-) Transcript_51729:1071-1784(-)
MGYRRRCKPPHGSLEIITFRYLDLLPRSSEELGTSMWWNQMSPVSSSVTLSLLRLCRGGRTPTPGATHTTSFSLALVATVSATDSPASDHCILMVSGEERRLKRPALHMLWRALTQCSSRAEETSRPCCFFCSAFTFSASTTRARNCANTLNTLLEPASKWFSCSANPSRVCRSADASSIRMSYAVGSSRSTWCIPFASISSANSNETKSSPAAAKLSPNEPSAASTFDADLLGSGW